MRGKEETLLRDRTAPRQMKRSRRSTFRYRPSEASRLSHPLVRRPPRRHGQERQYPLLVPPPSDDRRDLPAAHPRDVRAVDVRQDVADPDPPGEDGTAPHGGDVAGTPPSRAVGEEYPQLARGGDDADRTGAGDGLGPQDRVDAVGLLLEGTVAALGGRRPQDVPAHRARPPE
ncbi:hypothetical protein THAOC_26574 [Thalassiosira oceanica]|uniref:Uncharacterized protein n=1 Tax=Thalassiosira oceanica TaxID=159749 RepID=K0RJL9_THAOC|nr:hypothetical protein THAOC_26574 [Thalassiosira oceanica]|eukprot:EJK53898.1 hypothetical protein THAOC_26574 [Thalassiosira oceanica]